MTRFLVAFLINASVLFGQDFRSIDGSGNHPTNVSWGQTETALMRIVGDAYADGASQPAGLGRPNPRTISNIVSSQSVAKLNTGAVTAFLWQWGQFVDHDIVLAEVFTDEPMPIGIPVGDPDFDPFATGTAAIEFYRSACFEEPGVAREQINSITAFIDASNVYGSDEVRARALRTLDGTGRLNTSVGNLLPFNTGELPNAGSGPKYFLAGDVRANEQVGLTALHTVFVREHNRLADEIRARSPRLPGDDVYQQARAVVGAEMQAITYKEFLPILLGSGALRRYGGFRPDTDPSISNIFAAAAYRFGHSMLNSRLLRLDARGREIAAGHLSLAEAFFRPDRMLLEGGIEPILRGLAAQTAEDVDVYVVDEVRNFLFGPPGAGGMDLVSLNIQRGRDHGLPDYNSVRVALGLEPVTTFPQISSSPEIQNRLHDAYGSVDDIDVWVGSLAEDHVEGAMVGELTRAILADQFERLRDGDRFWYWRIFSGTRLVELESTTLAKVIQRNSTIGDELPANVFVGNRYERAMGPMRRRRAR